MTIQQDAEHAILDTFYADEAPPAYVDIDPGFVAELAADLATLPDDAFVPGDGYADDGDHDDLGSAR